MPILLRQFILHTIFLASQFPLLHSCREFAMIGYYDRFTFLMRFNIYHAVFLRIKWERSGMLTLVSQRWAFLSAEYLMAISLRLAIS